MKNTKQFVAIVLTLMMVIALFPTAALAAKTEDPANDIRYAYTAQDSSVTADPDEWVTVIVELDGATAWESFWHVTLPYISPFVILNCVYALVDTFVDARNPVMSLLSNLNQAGNKYGVAAALSWMYMLATLLVILIFILLTRRWLR